MIYQQSTGALTDDDGVFLCTGYAGRDGVVLMEGRPPVNGKNNPELQNLHNVGPLPRGTYTISPLHVVPHLGPCCALTPDPANVMFGRSGFFIHLDNPAHVGASSDGCIVLHSRWDLETVATLANTSNKLTVIC